MKLKNVKVMIILVIFFIAVLPLSVTFAVDDPDEPAAFKNQTEAERAFNLAEAYAAKPDPELEKALGEVDKAQNAYDVAELAAMADNEVTEDEQTTLDELSDTLDVAKKTADEQLADTAGVSKEEIAAMRDEGMGWGQIAHDLGLHPGVLGLGHAKKSLKDGKATKDVNPDDEIEQATARNFKSGLSKGHGAADKNEKGKVSDNGKSKGNNGKGNSKGNNGKGKNK